jgi:hypothetical protein
MAVAIFKQRTRTKVTMKGPDAFVRRPTLLRSRNNAPRTIVQLDAEFQWKEQAAQQLGTPIERIPTKNK